MQLFINNLTNVDFSYLHPQRGLVGETWLASITLEGALDDSGMVCDFGVVKSTLRQWLDTYIDHCLLVPTGSKHLDQFSRDSDNTQAQWTFNTNLTLATQGPNCAITLIESETITPESVAKWCIEQLRPYFGDSVNSIELSFEAEVIHSPFYHYSHGLKKHKGNCQRIAHGHRSKIEIWRNGELSHSDMANWATQWQDIYIGTKDDIVKQDEYTIDFAYESQQGAFALSLPKQVVDIIETDSTVEFIASHIAKTLKAAHPTDTFTVKAYEGLAKGAIATS